MIKQLINFAYTGAIIINKHNVQVTNRELYKITVKICKKNKQKNTRIVRFIKVKTFHCLDSIINVVKVVEVFFHLLLK